MFTPAVRARQREKVTALQFRRFRVDSWTLCLLAVWFLRGSEPASAFPPGIAAAVRRSIVQGIHTTPVASSPRSPPAARVLRGQLLISIWQ